MVNTVSIWPKPVLRRAFLSKPASIEDVEEILCGLFPSGHPILLSSGRAAISIVVRHLNLSRTDRVDVFPYASHCVLDAVARQALPQVEAPDPSLRIVYHQMGYVQHRPLHGVIAEDAVDTLCAPQTSLRPLGGDFEIWSLPKIVGTLGGAVLWCRSIEQAQALKAIRTEAGGRHWQWLMRGLGSLSPTAHLWWQGAEANLGEPVSWQVGEIKSALSGWNSLVERRLANLSLIKKLQPDWLQLTAGRLPSCVPVETEQGAEIAQEFELEYGYRHFSRYDESGACRMHRVLPIPIHQDMSIDRLNAIVRRLDGKRRVS